MRTHPINKGRRKRGGSRDSYSSTSTTTPQRRLVYKTKQINNNNENDIKIKRSNKTIDHSKSSLSNNNSHNLESSLSLSSLLHNDEFRTNDLLKLSHNLQTMSTSASRAKVDNNNRNISLITSNKLDKIKSSLILRQQKQQSRQQSNNSAAGHDLIHEFVKHPHSNNKRDLILNNCDSKVKNTKKNQSDKTTITTRATLENTSTTSGGMTYGPSNHTQNHQTKEDVHVLKFILLRENYLHRLQKLAKKSKRQICPGLIDLLDIIRICTVETVEAISQWQQMKLSKSRKARGKKGKEREKKSFDGDSVTKPPFLWNGINYLGESHTVFLDRSIVINYTCMTNFILLLLHFCPVTSLQ